MPRLLWIAALCLAAAPGCVLGSEQDPGCRTDAGCDQGFVCRAGACLRYSTDASPPNDPADTGTEASIDAATDAATDPGMDAAPDAAQD